MGVYVGSHIKFRSDMVLMLYFKSESFPLDSFMGESSKFPKSWTLEIQNFKTCRTPTKMNRFKFKWLIVFRSSEN